MAGDDLITDDWLPSDVAPAAAAANAAPATASAPQLSIPLGTSMADAERQLILATLAHYNNHKERTAAVLGVSLKTLYNRLKEYSSDRLEPPPAA
jgi:two-component system response regulator AtoC